MKKKNYFLAVLVLAVILTAGVGRAWAYFTTYAKAEGGYTIQLGDRTEIREDYEEWVKHVSISNDAESQPVYIRARAFSGTMYKLQYLDDTGRWTLGEDGYYYYGDMVKAGESTGELLIKISSADGMDVPRGEKDGDSFHVAVIYESTPVRYDTEGNPYADWKSVVDSGKVEGGKGE